MPVKFSNITFSMKKKKTQPVKDAVNGIAARVTASFKSKRIGKKNWLTKVGVKRYGHRILWDSHQIKSFYLTSDLLHENKETLA